MLTSKKAGTIGGILIILQSLGAAEEVTGSKHFLEVNGKTYEIDCGAWQGESFSIERNREYSYPIDKLQCILLSHAHFDHCGLLPKIVKDGFQGKIYSTPATRDLAAIVMLDSAKIQSRYRNGPVYTEQDVIDTMTHFRCHAYHKEKKIDDNITYTMYDAGHILGSAMIDIAVDKKQTLFQKLLKKTPEKMHILFTGDLGREVNPITKKPETCIPAPSYIILESTYGNKLHETIRTARNEFANIINETIDRGGKVIIPSFAIERAQELIYYIKCLMQEKKIPRVPVYVDSPMITNATGVFSIHPECFNETIIDKFFSKGKNPFSVRSLEFVSDAHESTLIAKKNEPSIVIAANGMCEAGRILNHLKYGIENKNNTILIVGYTCENTLGRKILQGDKKVTIERKEYNVEARVASIDAFSAHADYKEIESWLSQTDTSKLKKIFLVHGEKEAQASLKSKLEKLGYKTEIVKENTNYIL